MAGVRMGFFTNNRWFSLEIFNSSCMGDWRCNDWKCTTNYICIYIEAMKYMFAWVSPTTWMISQNLDPCFGRIRSKLKQNSKKTKEYGRDAVASTPWGWTVWPVPMRWPGRGELWDDWIWLAPEIYRNLNSISSSSPGRPCGLPVTTWIFCPHVLI